MRTPLLVLIAGCGRLGFAGQPDAPDDAADPSGLVARYAMDDDPATGVVHAEPATFDAPCAPCPTAAPGRLGGGYAFDGATRVVLPSTTLVGLAPFTVAVWALPAAGNGLSSLVGKPLDTTTYRNVLSVTFNGGDNSLAFETTIAGLTDAFPVNPTDAVLVPGAWHHIAASWDGAERRLYLDGALVGAGVGTFADSDLAVAIGADLDQGSPAIFFHGTLDEIRFYDRALALAEITALANP